MNIELLSDKMELTALANKLYMYCDQQQWQKMIDEVFTEKINFDVSHAGGGAPSIMYAKDVCELWRQGFIGLDAVHHQAGHYLITVNTNDADIYAYAVATHYKREAKKGNTRTFVGSYDLKAVRTKEGWRLSQFKYNLKYLEGNTAME